MLTALNITLPRMVDFHKDWYNNLISHSNEKHLLVEKISDLLQGKTHENCLEIGLGTSAYFAERLSGLFEEYWVVEKNKFNHPVPSNVKLIEGDFEDVVLGKKFDVILASHVVYYFKDLPKTVQKIVDSLKENGRAYFVVNGKESDYGPIKDVFAIFINEPYAFTYDILKAALRSYQVKEYTTQASLSFNSYEDLYETLRLSFDLYPTEYEQQRQKVIDWLKQNVKGEKFFIDQKIIKVSNSAGSDPWKDLLAHDTHDLFFGDVHIVVDDGVFTPNPDITYTTSMVLENLPPLQNMRVADVGTGTGILAIKAAKEGAEVVATDNSDFAVKNATANVEANNVSTRVKVLKANLLDGVDGTFDIIFANIPILSEVWDSKDDCIAKRLLESTRDKLRENGSIYIPWGSFAEGQRKHLEDTIIASGYTFRLMCKQHIGYTWYLYIVSKQ
jgi:methylase of polypeptide subunit release factors